MRQLCIPSGISGEGSVLQAGISGFGNYQVTARYVVIDGEPCVMELIKRMDKDVLGDAHDREQLLDKLSSYKEKLYLDALTGAYNRRYYEMSQAPHRPDRDRDD